MPLTRQRRPAYPRWMTYKQAKAVGGQVRKGEHGTTAIFYTTLEKENDNGETDYIPMLKTSTVFNVEQIDGLPLKDEAVFPAETFEPLPRAEALFYSSGATIIEKGQNAFFTPSTDEIRLPERYLFIDAANFYAIRMDKGPGTQILLDDKGQLVLNKI